MLRSLVFVAICLALAGPAAADTPREWKSFATLLSGQNTFCNNGGPVLIVEEKGKFTNMNRAKSFVGWTVPMADDGSVAADVRSAYVKRLIRVQVPAGTGPRVFEVVDLSYACRFRYDPDTR